MKLQLVRSLALSAGFAISAPSAIAQCTWYIDGVPDFDQRRTIQTGLPQNGSMYCVPTSFTNWFAYVANRGLPQPLTLDGPRNWQDNANYARVTNVLTMMGTLMDTDPAEGTGTSGAISGATSYITLGMSGDLVVGGGSAWGSGLVPTPSILLSIYKLGGYPIAGYGFYGNSTGGTRGGGHVVSVTGVWDLTCGQAPILQFRDPADDPEDATQSPFRTSLAAMTAVTGQFRPAADEDMETKTLYRLDTNTVTGNFLDSVFAVFPTSAIFSLPFRSAGQLDLVTPFRPTDNPAPESRLFNSPAGTGVILDLATGHSPLVHYYITDRTGQQAAGVWKLDLLSGISSRLTTNTNPRRLAVGRLGDLYVVDNNGVNRYSLATTPATFLTTYSPSTDVAALAYDDKSDTVMLLTDLPTVGPRRVITRPRALTGVGTDRSLPVSLTGDPFIAPDAEVSGAFFVCGSGGGILSRIEYSTQAGALVQTHSIMHLNASLTGLNVTDANRLVYAVNGVLVEKEQNAQGQWVNRAGSRWAGRAAAGMVSMARSREDSIASIFNGPSFNNLPSPTVYPSLPTCYANCDNSTGTPALTANDFQCFINKFAAQHVYANCDQSTGTPALTANDFQCFIDAYAAGCS